jgi:hypothetical protein
MIFQWTRDIIKETLELIDCPVWYDLNDLNTAPRLASSLQGRLAVIPTIRPRACVVRPLHVSITHSRENGSNASAMRGSTRGSLFAWQKLGDFAGFFG